MKVVAKTEDYTIYQKRNQRYGIRKDDRNWVNGADKVAILLEHKLIEVAATNRHLAGDRYLENGPTPVMLDNYTHQ